MLWIPTKSQLEVYNEVSSMVFYKRKVNWLDRFHHMKGVELVGE